ncbi:hypothetical protein K2173_015624 [Erythroxylum novogranatense]|uniref:S-acyltransferase n=1 Tax=Erythroxylum novogranatense TaxID=1862640 RepID=A0AAV8SEX6_9ROSI|nr:hypothetical protein K2173_015624 [Erythroxylum novogranatense]
MLAFEDGFWKKEKLQRVACFNSNSIGRCSISCVFVLVTQFALSLVPRFFYASSLLAQLALSGFVLLLVVGLGRWFRRLVGVYASAPAFVFFSLLFVWGVYIVLVRQAIPRVMDFVFNAEMVFLVLGLYSILSSNPGFVSCGSSQPDNLAETDAFGVKADLEGTSLFKRVRYCKCCKAYVRGFDHHCPAFGNCIGQNNHVLFMVLVVGFLSTEASHVVMLSHILGRMQDVEFETNLAVCLVIGTRLFTLLQVLWQVVFLAWHIYCICFNIKTDEWVNWKRYPEFQVTDQSQPGENFTGVRFANPYDKGIFQNVKVFLRAEA